MNIENRNIETVYPYEKNAKKHPKKQVEQVAQSIAEFGFNQPIVIDKKGVIIVGHGRYEAAKLLGLEEVPTMTVDLPKKKADAYRLADNKLNESDWDMELVLEELKAIADKTLVELTGFDAQLLLEVDDKDDAVPELGKKAKSKLGDVYQLGNHIVMCGSATEGADVQKLMGGGASRYGLHRPTIQRQLFRNRQGHLQQNHER